MIDSQKCMQILKTMVEGFENRLSKIVEFKAQVQQYLQKENLITDDKMVQTFKKELAKIEKQINAMDSKIQIKQSNLLNSNKLQELEKEILNNAKTINADDERFLISLNEIVDEIKDSNIQNEIEFALNYINICEQSTLRQKEIFEKQLNFLKEVFKEEE